MKKILSVFLAFLLLCGLLAGCGGSAAASSESRPDTTGLPAAPDTGSSTPASANALPYRAVWFSYLDWAALDISSEEAFTQSAKTVMQNCAALGSNCVILQVRPFGDAIYPSSVYGWSYLCTGTAGQNPGYDPLQILLDAAHAQGLAVEAWINPYRVRTSATYPVGEYGADNPALAHEDWTVAAADGLYYNPCIPGVQEMVINGVKELVQNYQLEGIHFDDYFYPTTEESFDAAYYAAYSGNLPLADWRRENVNTLIRTTYDAIKAINSKVVFGISPQGNNDNNYNTQYSDVGLWLRESGYVDYIMPQIYWGFNYTLSNGKDTYAFKNITNYWASLARHADVALCFGLGAYRIGAGDGGTNDQSEWENGHNLADQITALQSVDGAKGYALFRYSSLFANAEYAQLAAAETAAIAAAAKNAG